MRYRSMGATAPGLCVGMESELRAGIVGTAWVLPVTASIVLIAACGGGDSSVADIPDPDRVPPFQLALSLPVVGIPNETVFLGAYFTHGAAGSESDYECGAKWTDGHRGVDILLRNFVEQDSGVVVQAVVAGTVSEIQDGLFDRQVERGSPDGFGNLVRVRHASGFSTIYAHLRSGSVAVAVGDPVVPGDRLGLVGSSGNSNWPHLHFEVFDVSGASIDPFSGPCSPTDQSVWPGQIGYQDQFQVLDGGFIPAVQAPNGGMALLLERPADVDSIRMNAGNLAVWIQLSNIQSDSTRVDVIDPSGGVKSQQLGSIRTFSLLFLLGTFAPVEDLTVPGTWTVEFLQASGGAPMTSAWQRSFELLPAIVAVPPSERAQSRTIDSGFFITPSAGDSGVGN